MADYLTPDGLRAVLARTTVGDTDPGYTGTAAVLTDDELTTAIGQAQDEVNARLGVRYTTPFNPPPALVVTLVADIAGYLATLTYRAGDPVVANDPVALRYTRAEQLVAALANGSATMPEAPTPTAAGEIAVQNPYEGSLWSAADYDLVSVPRSGWPVRWL